MPSDVRADELGAALLEAALVLPVLLILVFGLADISLYFWNQNLAIKAVQVGVRRAVVSDSVAVGPGLDPAESTHYWDGLKPGARCSTEAAGGASCPSFTVTCDLEQGCRCSGDACAFRLDAGRLAQIAQSMQAIMPDLRPADIEISYATNGAGYVARPVPVPVDVTVSLLGMHYKPLFLGDFLGKALPLHGTARLPSESLSTR